MSLAFVILPLAQLGGAQVLMDEEKNMLHSLHQMQNWTHRCTLLGYFSKTNHYYTTWPYYPTPLDVIEPAVVGEG